MVKKGMRFPTEVPPKGLRGHLFQVVREANSLEASGAPWPSWRAGCRVGPMPSRAPFLLSLDFSVT